MSFTDVIQFFILGYLIRQVTIQNKSFQFDRYLKLSKQIDDEDYETIESLRKIFFKNGKNKLVLAEKILNSKGKAKKNLKTRVLKLLRSYANIGVLVQQGVQDKLLTMNYHARPACRVWIMLEHYIRKERILRSQETWHWGLQYLAVEGFRYLLTTQSKLTILAPDPQNEPYLIDLSKINLRRMEYHVTIILKRIKLLSWRRDIGLKLCSFLSEASRKFNWLYYLYLPCLIFVAVMACYLGLYYAFVTFSDLKPFLNFINKINNLLVEIIRQPLLSLIHYFSSLEFIPNSIHFLNSTTI